MDRVDWVPVNRFTGWLAVDALKGAKRTESCPLDRPIGQFGLHLMVPRNSERGAALLDAVNAQLASMRESGELRTIINRYLELYQLQYGVARRSATGLVR